MLDDIGEILFKYWNYKSFRPLQETIIRSVIEGNDTLAILPTGGGKSLCYQIPALYREGICLVITPLIALMKDQVINLHQRNIKASAIHSGMNAIEINNIISNCVFGQTKLLYISPERLQSEYFQKQLLELPVSLIAVDEAHCISQWGHDFRPAYRQIHKMRTHFKNIPVLALTASATEEVVDDIQSHLNFSEKNVFKASFLRENISLNVICDDNKWGRLDSVIKKSLGSSIIYVRNRKLTKEIARYINQLGVNAGFYHAGMKDDDKNKMQEFWMRGNYEVMVCTNAFGMGIDKDNVRMVMHWGIPDSQEAYYQEVGRAGRDGKRSYALMIYDEKDLKSLNDNFKMQFPELKKIRQIYQALSNFFQVPINVKTSKPFSFELIPFCHHYGFNYLETNHILRVLCDLSYIHLTQPASHKSRLKIIMDKKSIFEMGHKNEVLAEILQCLLRSYGGIFDEHQEINEQLIANRLNIELKDLERSLKQLHKVRCVSYSPKKESPQLYFLKGRIDAKSVHLDPVSWNKRKESLKDKLDSMLSFVSTADQCRNKLLLNYFGEQLIEDCRRCDYCRNKYQSDKEQKKLEEKLKAVIDIESKHINDVLASFSELDKENVVRLIRKLVNSEVIELDKEHIQWVEKK